MVLLDEPTYLITGISTFLLTVYLRSSTRAISIVMLFFYLFWLGANGLVTKTAHEAFLYYPTVILTFGGLGLLSSGWINNSHMLDPIFLNEYEIKGFKKPGRQWFMQAKVFFSLSMFIGSWVPHEFLYAQVPFTGLVTVVLILIAAGISYWILCDEDQLFKPHQQYVHGEAITFFLFITVLQVTVGLVYTIAWWSIGKVFFYRNWDFYATLIAVGVAYAVNIVYGIFLISADHTRKEKLQNGTLARHLHLYQVSSSDNVHAPPYAPLQSNHQ